jgi:hypothetical protein
VVAGQDQMSQVRFLLPDGRSVRVHGVCAALASALESWRLKHVQAAVNQPTMPTALPPDTRQRIELGHAAEEKRLQEQRTLAEQARQSHRSDLVQRHAAEIRQVTDRHNATARAMSQAIADARRRLEAARAEHEAATREVQSIGRVLRTHRHLTYRRFLRVVVFGR